MSMLDNDVNEEDKNKATAKDQKNFYDAVIIGGGPAGLTAGLYLARACYRVLIIEKEKFGGQITITAEVVNYPGADPMSGAALTERMRRQAESFGAEFSLTAVQSMDFSEPVIKVRTGKGEIQTLGVILATGAHPRMIGFEGEAQFKGRGVAYCATCDGEFFTGKEVFVVGGGFAAAEEAVFLTKYASHVTILIREDDFTCAAQVADAARQHEKISVRTNTEVVRVTGDSMLRSIRLRDLRSGDVSDWAPENGDTFGIFVFAGYEPSTELIRGIADCDAQGYVITDRSLKTTRDGLYAAGDVCIKSLRQVVTATGDGALAATELEKYISKMQKETGRRATLPAHRASQHKVMDSGSSSTPAPASVSELFDTQMVAQLNTVFSRMEQGLELHLWLDSRPVSSELKTYMEELAALTDKLTVSIQDNGSETETPCVRVFRADGSSAGIAFHGAPGGHEFTSFVLGLYNASCAGQAVPEPLKHRIHALSRDMRLTVMVSLSCTMCPELVTAAQKIATLNPHITTDVYDLNHFEALKERYHVMSVPCFVVNDGSPDFGKKDLEQLTTLLEAKQAEG